MASIQKLTVKFHAELVRLLNTITGSGSLTKPSTSSNCLQNNLPGSVWIGDESRLRLRSMRRLSRAGIVDNGVCQNIGIRQDHNPSICALISVRAQVDLQHGAIKTCHAQSLRQHEMAVEATG